jgi:amino acid permease
MMRIGSSADGWAGVDQLPFDFATAFSHYQWTAIVDLVIGAGGTAAALGIYWGRRWGWLTLASVLFAAGAVGLGYRVMAGQSMCPCLGGSLLSTFVLSGFCWFEVHRQRKRNEGGV